MLDNAAENLRIRLREVTAGPLSADETMEILKEFLDNRRLSQRVVALDFPLDDFMGLIMIDRYDETHIAVIDSLITHYVSGNPTLPGSDAADVFIQRLGNLPPIGETPTAFIVSILISREWQAAYSIPRGDPMKEGVTQIALRAMGQAAKNYMQTRTGETHLKSDEFWHASVIQRMICPEHRSAYTMKEIRNGMKTDGSIFRRYVVQCVDGEESRSVDFDLGVLSEMTRSGGTQKLKSRVHSPAEKLPTVEP